MNTATVKNIAASAITTLQDKGTDIQTIYREGATIRTKYNSLKEKLELATIAAESEYTNYGSPDKSKQFARGKILDGKNCDGGDDCCKATKAVIDAEKALKECYEEKVLPIINVSSCSTKKAGFLGISIAPVQAQMNMIVDKLADLIGYINENQSETLVEGVDDEVSRRWNEIKAEVAKLRKTGDASMIPGINAVMAMAKELFQEAHDSAIEQADAVYPKHVKCHNDFAFVRFYNDPTTYTNEGSYYGTPIEKLVWKDYSLADCNEETPDPVEITPYVTFVKWDDNFSPDNIVENDVDVHGVWNIRPTIEIDIEDEEKDTHDLQRVQMFANVQTDADNYANSVVDQKNADEDRAYDYSLGSTPASYIVDANNYILRYSISRTKKRHTVSIYLRDKNGPNSWSNYRLEDTSEVEHNDNFKMDSSSDLAKALTAGSNGYINDDHTKKTVADGVDESYCQNITNDFSLHFSQIDLYKATYADIANPSTVPDIEAYSTFNVEDNRPTGWPSNPKVESGNAYILCSAPDEYTVDGNPNEVTSNLTIIPQYGDPISLAGTVQATIQLAIEHVPYEEVEEDGTIIIHHPSLPPISDTTSLTTNADGKFEVAERRKLIKFKEDFLLAVRENYSEYPNESNSFEKERNQLFTPIKIEETRDFARLIDISLGESLLGSSIHLKDLADPNNISAEVFVKSFSDTIELVVHKCGYDAISNLYEMAYDLGFSQDPQNIEYTRNSFKNSYNATKRVYSEYSDALRIVDREPYNGNKKIRSLLDLDGYEEGEEIVVPPNDPNAFKAIVVKKQMNYGDGDRIHFIGAVKEPSVHWVYGSDIPRHPELNGTEIIPPQQFDPRKYGDFSGWKVDGIPIPGYIGGYFDQNLIVPTKNFTDKTFAEDVIFTYTYVEDSASNKFAQSNGTFSKLSSGVKMDEMELGPTPIVDNVSLNEQITFVSDEENPWEAVKPNVFAAKYLDAEGSFGQLKTFELPTSNNYSEMDLSREVIGASLTFAKDEEDISNSKYVADLTLDQTTNEDVVYHTRQIYFWEEYDTSVYSEKPNDEITYGYTVSIFDSHNNLLSTRNENLYPIELYILPTAEDPVKIDLDNDGIPDMTLASGAYWKCIETNQEFNNGESISITDEMSNFELGYRNIIEEDDDE